MDVPSSTNSSPLLKASSVDVLRKFLVIFPIVFFVVFSFIYIVAHLEFKRVATITAKEELLNIKLLRFVIHNDLQALASDLLLLANNESLQRYFEDDSKENLAKLSARFSGFTRDKKIYTQVRYCNADGREVVRINMNGLAPENVPAAELQDKSRRYYFRRTLALDWGHVFVSPLDLNFENGEVERPFAPVMRLGSPVIDRYGNKKGIVLLNFDGEKILDRFSLAFPEKDESRFSFLNKDGYWLRSGNPEDEWGFMFGNKITLESRLPKLWEEIQTKKLGQIRLESGLYTYITIYTEDEVKQRANFTGDSGMLRDHEYVQDRVVWHLVLHIPEEELTFLFFIKKYTNLYWLFPVLLIAIMAASLHRAIIWGNKDVYARTLTLLSTGLEQSPAAVVITDKDGNIEYVNPKFSQMSGYDKEMVIGENPRIFKSGSTGEDIYKDLWDTVLQGNVWSGSFENKRKDQSPYYVSASISPIVNKEGEITRFIGVQEDVTEKKQLQEELEKLATTDALTGVYNRSHFLDCLNHELRRATRYRQTLSVLAFDLDHFKNVNDTYGHHGGDLALQGFTEVVQGELRESDFLGRLGGEEFSAVLVQTDEDGAQLLAERLRIAVERLQVSCDGKIIQFTVSIGVAEWNSKESDTDELLKRADRALYAAKYAGRNQVKISKNEDSVPPADN